MSIKDQIYQNLISYKKDTVFEHRFAQKHEKEVNEWNKALYNNEIIFLQSGQSFHFDDFRKMDFSGPEIDHQEWHQQINRFFWLKYATFEYRKNKSEHMAKIVFDTINAWMEYWPNYGDRKDIYPFRQHEFWDPMINTPLRLGFGDNCGWVGCVPHFFDHPLFDDDFVKKFVECVLWQIKPMVYNNRYRGQDNNWRPNELDSLLFISQIIPGASEYEEYAVKHLNDAFISQFENDGSHIEHTDDYHNWMSDVFAVLGILSFNRPALGLKINPLQVIKSQDYGLLSKAPDGRSFGIHDSECWHENNKVLTKRILAVRDYIATLTNQKLFEDQYTSQSNFPYHDAKQYFFKDTMSMVFFDASKWGGSHTHMSRNSVNMYYGNKMIITDPGTLNYGACWERNYGKSTPSHNTVTINNLTQLYYANPEIEEYYADDNVSLLVSDYTGGYQHFFKNNPCITAEHERIFIMLKNKFTLVFDNINIRGNQKVNNIASHWQFKKNDVVHDQVKQLAYSTFNDYNVVIKKLYSSEKSSSIIYDGSTEPLLGYNSKTGEKLSGAINAPMFSIECNTSENHVKIAQILVPYEKDCVPEIEVEAETTLYAMLFTIKLNDEIFKIASHYFVRNDVKSNSMIREIGDIDSGGRVYIEQWKDNKIIYKWSYKDGNE